MKINLVGLLLVYLKVAVLGETNTKDDNPYLEAIERCPLAQESVHGYFEVRPGAHMFYWFYYADGTKLNAHEKPIIIWIQGGPGYAASGVGNFGELGPINMNMEPRNHTWVRGRNLLLLDHPVGTGFSYVTNTSLYARTDEQVVLDLTTAIYNFFTQYQEFLSTPTYLFGQSYGGKLCPQLGFHLYMKKQIDINFKGIGIGAGWVNPKESVSVLPEFLYHAGIIDRKLYLKTSIQVEDFKRALDSNDYVNSGRQYFSQYYNIFNALNKDKRYNSNNVYAPSVDSMLKELNGKINNFVKPTLKVNQSLNWSYTSLKVYKYLEGNIIWPTSYFVETLLNNTNLKIVVYNGIFDSLTPLAGASNWVHKLYWPGANDFANAKRHELKGDNNGFFKEHNQLSFWTVFGAGHWIPEDNPEAMEQILEYMTNK